MSHLPNTYPSATGDLFASCVARERARAELVALDNWYEAAWLAHDRGAAGCLSAQEIGDRNLAALDAWYDRWPGFSITTLFESAVEREEREHIASRPARRATQQAYIAEVKKTWAAMDAEYESMSPEDKLNWDRQEYDRQAFDAWEQHYDSREPQAIKDARYTVRLANIWKTFEHLLPECQQWQPAPDVIYPKGTIELYRQKSLAEEIERLRKLQEAQLVLEIYNLESELEYAA